MKNELDLPRDQTPVLLNSTLIRSCALVVMTIACLAAEPVPICSAVTVADASTILGPSAKRTPDPSGCDWQAGNRQLSIVRVGVASMFERARTSSARDGKTDNEKGLGGEAFSATPSKNHGGRTSIYLLKGSAVLIVDISGFPDGTAPERLPQLRDLVRKLAPAL